jgi:hypothetical protein
MAKVRSARVQMISVDETIGGEWERYEKLFQQTFNVQ